MMMMHPGMMVGSMMQGGPPQPNMMIPHHDHDGMSNAAPLPSVKPKQKKANNFFSDSPGISADAQLNELEQVANDA